MPVVNRVVRRGVDGVVDAVAPGVDNIVEGTGAGAMFFALNGAQNRLPGLAQQSPIALLLFIQEQAVRIMLGAGLAYLVLAIADYGYQVWRHEKSLKMSKEEIKRELKETEGDQILKVRRRTLARALARRRMLLAVSDADVVVTNPTHIAVALKYDICALKPTPIVKCNLTCSLGR